MERVCDERTGMHIEIKRCAAARETCRHTNQVGCLAHLHPGAIGIGRAGRTHARVEGCIFTLFRDICCSSVRFRRSGSQAHSA